MRGQGQHSPLGWAALTLVLVAYAHVILELAVAVLAVAIAVRVIMSPAPGLMVRHVGRQVRRYRTGRLAAQPPAALNGRAVEVSANGSQASEPAERE